MAFIDTVKPWFQTFKFPTQAQFYYWMERIRWIDQPIAINEITNLESVINNLAQPLEVFTTGAGAFTYTIPADFLLEKIVIKPSSDTNAFCSTEGGTDGDIVAVDVDNVITEARGAVWSVDQQAISVSRNIVISGLPSGSTLVFIKRKIVL